jgi:hypothetical protein
MAASFSDCKVISDILATYSNPAAFGIQASLVMEQQKAPTSFAQGTGAGQASQLYASDGRSLATGANETLDLTNLTDPLGNAINFTRVMAIEIVANAANTTTLTVGAAASNPFLGPLGGTAPTVALKAGERMLFAASASSGWSTSSANNLKVSNAAGATATYSIKVVG